MKNDFVNVGDILLLELETNAVLLWKVNNIYLGALNEESFVQLIPLGRKKGEVTGYGEISSFIPAQILDATIKADIVKIIYRSKKDE